MIIILRWILLPFSFLYLFIIWIRNILYDYNILKSKSFETPNIVIGNLAVGGAGKSPMTEYLIRLLRDKYKIATLSRGYGRKTKGFRYVETNSLSTEVGDEPLQFKRKFEDITVAVNENRCEGIEKLQSNHDIIILDDAYQHRKLKSGFSVLLFDYNSLLKPTILLPTGNFRDIMSSTKRANIIVITKCPQNISDKQKAQINKKIRNYTQSPIFYTRIDYDQPKNSRGENINIDLSNKEILLVCGIANPHPLIEFLTNKNNTVHLMAFGDHHNYSPQDFNKIKSKFDELDNENKIILTTEKDMQRIQIDAFQQYPLLYIPIQLSFVDDQSLNFDKIIENYISQK